MFTSTLINNCKLNKKYNIKTLLKKEEDINFEFSLIIKKIANYRIEECIFLNISL